MKRHRPTLCVAVQSGVSRSPPERSCTTHVQLSQPSARSTPNRSIATERTISTVVVYKDDRNIPTVVQKRQSYTDR